MTYPTSAILVLSGLFLLLYSASNLISHWPL